MSLTSPVTVVKMYRTLLMISSTVSSIQPACACTENASNPIAKGYRMPFMISPSRDVVLPAEFASRARGDIADAESEPHPARAGGAVGGATGFGELSACPIAESRGCPAGKNLDDDVVFGQARRSLHGDGQVGQEGRCPSAGQRSAGDGDAVAPVLLRRIARLVGIPEQRGRRLDRRGECRHPQAAGDGKSPALVDERVRLDGGANALGELDAALRVRVREQDHELFAAVAREDVPGLRESRRG